MINGLIELPITPTAGQQFAMRRAGRPRLLVGADAEFEIR